jgi:hypothetical protein
MVVRLTWPPGSVRNMAHTDVCQADGIAETMAVACLNKIYVWNVLSRSMQDPLKTLGHSRPILEDQRIEEIHPRSTQDPLKIHSRSPQDPHLEYINLRLLVSN